MDILKYNALEQELAILLMSENDIKKLCKECITNINSINYSESNQDTISLQAIYSLMSLNDHFKNQ